MLKVLTITDIQVVAAGSENCLSSEYLLIRSCLNGCVSGSCAGFSIASTTNIPKLSNIGEDQSVSENFVKTAVVSSLFGCIAGCMFMGMMK